MSDDYTRELEAALSDLEQHTPEAPRFSDIRAGGPVLLTDARSRRMSGPAVLMAAAAVTVLVVGLAAWIASDRGPNDLVARPEESTGSIYGIWVVESVTYEGETTDIDPEQFSDSRLPYVEITESRIEGWSGCNSIDGQAPPEFADGLLTPGEVVVTAAGCNLDVAEPAMLAVMWSEDPIAVDVSDTSMSWTSSEAVVTFRRTDLKPGFSMPEWRTASELIDCSPSPIISINVSADAQDAKPVLAAFPGVETIEGDGLLGGADPWARGFDADGNLVAVAAPGDIMPPLVHLSACADSFGIRPGANLTGSVATWVNGLGLGQTSQHVWNERFAELCASEQPDLADLAARYVEEDLPMTLRAGGLVPTPDEATQTLEVVWLSACERGPATVTTIAPTTTVPDTTTTSIEPSGESACSADGLEVDDAGFSTPPPLVAENTRELLIGLALDCDFAGLVALAAEGATEQFDDAIFWGAAQSVETLREYDATANSLRRLAVALSTLPYGVYDGQRVDPESGDTVPDVYYSWPPRADIPEGGSITDVWDPDLLVAVAALNEMSLPDLIELTDSFGAYAGFRVGITESGRWLFALAGD